MDKIHEIAGDVAQMPRFDDGMADMAELIRVTAESPVNEICVLSSRTEQKEHRELSRVRTRRAHRF